MQTMQHRLPAAKIVPELLTICILRLDTERERVPCLAEVYAAGQGTECTILHYRLPAADINPVVRVDSSGSTELLTSYLATDSGWALGVGKSLNWPKCVKQVQGTDGILAYLTSQKNAIG